MKSGVNLVFGLGLFLIGGTAATLHWVRTHHRMGAPGVRVVSEKMATSSGAVETNYVALPLSLKGWTASTLPIQEIELKTLPKDTTFGRCLYTNAESQVQVNVVLMGTDRSSIHRPEFCLTGQGWGIERRVAKEIEVSRPTGYQLPVQRYDCSFNVSDRGSEHVLKGIYVFWFVADGKLTSDHRQRMWWMAGDLLTRGLLQRWAYVSFFSVCRPGDEDATYDRMAKLISETVPEFQTVAGR